MKKNEEIAQGIERIAKMFITAQNKELRTIELTGSAGSDENCVEVYFTVQFINDKDELKQLNLTYYPEAHALKGDL